MLAVTYLSSLYSGDVREIMTEIGLLNPTRVVKVVLQNVHGLVASSHV